MNENLKKKNVGIEILAPAGNYEMLHTAINSGCDSIYFGIAGFNLRANAKNFSIDEISKVIKICHQKSIKAYACLNIVIFEDELDFLKKVLDVLSKCKVDGVICWDFAVISIALKKGLNVHLSTQASVLNSISIKEYEKLGVSRIILARECSLTDIKKIQEKTNLELEIFIHGAMCVAVSGRCFISQYLYGKSANRGECIQPCRRSYDLIDPETSKELNITENYVMSPKDLCTIDIIDKLLELDVKCFKIEGRNRSPEYLKKTIECYKKAIEFYKKGILTENVKLKLKEELSMVYNRGFSTGFFLSKPINEWTDSYGNKSNYVKKYVGRILNYYKKINVAEVKLETENLNLNDKLIITGNKTGCVDFTLKSIQFNKKEINCGLKGQNVAIKVPFVVRKNDKVFIFTKK
ncbi:MAG: peptidase U32 family protein [Candidatus Woesearchaeota archaeon]